jgi:hypothetical protein
MPKFIDHHEMADVAPELAAGIAERVKSGEADDHGVRGLNVFLAKAALRTASPRRRTRRLSSRLMPRSASS